MSVGLTLAIMKKALIAHPGNKFQAFPYVKSLFVTLFLFALLSLHGGEVWGQGQKTGANDRDWSDGTNWSNGNVPGVNSGTATEPVYIRHNTVINQNVNIDKGIFVVGADGSKLTGRIYTVIGSSEVNGCSTNFTGELAGGNTIVYAGQQIGEIMPNLNLAGTYSRAGNIVSITFTNHNLKVGNGLFLDFTSGTAADGFYNVATVVDVNSFTVVHAASGNTSGDVTVKAGIITAEQLTLTAPAKVNTKSNNNFCNVNSLAVDFAKFEYVNTGGTSTLKNAFQPTPPAANNAIKAEDAITPFASNALVGDFYKLDMRNTNGYSGTLSFFDIRSGVKTKGNGTVVNFEDGAEINNSNLVVRSGSTLVLGPPSCYVCDIEQGNTFTSGTTTISASPFEWIVEHSRNTTKPAIQFLNANDEQIFPTATIEIINNNQIKVTFTAAFTGKVRVRKYKYDLPAGISTETERRSICTSDSSPCTQVRLKLRNNARILVEKDGQVIVYGDVENSANPGFVSMDGDLYIVGNYSTPNSGTASIIQTEPGIGDIYTTGSMTTQGNGTIFGSKVDCDADCSGLALACSGLLPSFTIIPSGVIAYCESTGQILSIDPDPLSTGDPDDEVSYQWQSRIEGGDFNDIVGETLNTLSISGSLGDPKFYRVNVIVNEGECSAFSVPVYLSQDINRWTGDSGADWTVNGNWCTNIAPTALTDAVIPTGASPNVPSSKIGYVRNLTIQGTNSLTDGALVTIESSGELNIHGNLVIAPDINLYSGIYTNEKSGKIVNSGTINFEGGGSNPDTVYITNVGKFQNTTGSIVNFNGVLNVEDIGILFPNEFTFHNIIVSAESSLKLYDITQSFYEITGDLTIDGNLDTEFATLLFSGSANQIIDANGNSFDKILVDKSGGSISLTSEFNLIDRLDFNSATSLVSGGNLVLRSLKNDSDATTNLTSNDAHIGPLPVGASVTGNIKVERFMRALPAGRLPYRYIAPPVKSSSYTGGGTIGKYNNISGTAPNYTLGSGSWKTHSGALLNGGGYRINASTERTIDFTGEVVSGELTWTFPSAGWYMIGNPYPSAVVWRNDELNSRWVLNNVSVLMGIYDNFNAGYPDYFRYAYMEIPEGGTLPPDQQWGFEADGNVIATGQAFWVYVGTGGGTLTIKEAAKVGSGEVGAFYKVDNSETSNTLVIALSNSSSRDLAILSSPSVSKQKSAQRFDNVPKLWNEEMNVYVLDNTATAMLKYSLTEESDLLIPIGISLTKPGEYQLTLGNQENFPLSNQLYLIDRYEGKYQALSENKPYTFRVYNASQAINDRFYLSSNAIVDWTEELSIYVYPNPVIDILHLRTQGVDAIAESILRDASGKVLDQAAWKGAYELKMNNFSNGLYILQVKTEQGIITRKIMKQ
jgi:hypothetical protein